MTQPTTTSTSFHQVVAALCRRDTNKARSILAQASNFGAAPKDSAFWLASEGLIGLSQSQLDGLRAGTSSLILLAEGCVVARMSDDNHTLEQIEKLMKAWPPLGFTAYPVVFGQVAQKALFMQQQSVRLSMDAEELDPELARNELRTQQCTSAVFEYLGSNQTETTADTESSAPRG